jgi:1-aminocyclopropane-1-carboxylate deaminase
MAIIKPIQESNIFVQELPLFANGASGVSVSMLRLDAIHPIISGNKWFKLKYNIKEALAHHLDGVLSFGGAYSNHLIATAAAAHAAGLNSVGIVRGVPANTDSLNDVLCQCKDYGMQLHFISRAQYALKNEPSFLSELQNQYPNHFFIPEGGANEAGRQGAAEIAQLIDKAFTHIVLSVGSGTTFIGLRNALPQHQHLLGFAPMKGGAYLKEEIKHYLNEPKCAHWALTDQFHFGGFGKSNNDLSFFMQEFEHQYGFSLDRVYTAKMMFGLRQLIAENKYPPDAKILGIHTGGLTGN